MAAHQELRDRDGRPRLCRSTRRGSGRTRPRLRSSRPRRTKRRPTSRSPASTIASLRSAPSSPTSSDKLAEGGPRAGRSRARADEGEHASATAEAEAEGAIADARPSGASKSPQQLSVVTERKVRLARVREQVAGAARHGVERLDRSPTSSSRRVAQLEEELEDVARQTGETAGAADRQARRRSPWPWSTGASAAGRAAEARRVFDEARHGARRARGGSEGLRAAVAEATERANAQSSRSSASPSTATTCSTGCARSSAGSTSAASSATTTARPRPTSEHAPRIAELAQPHRSHGPGQPRRRCASTRRQRQRHAFYTEQKADLEKALDDLDAAPSRR